MAIVAAL
jgi:hypothetical protein